ncbi:MAG: hypothetical protein FWE20_05070 [Defluviitaleaceae bacterium]|nr:hypothetical protein [Defluviitaleaceae bacterium]
MAKLFGLNFRQLIGKSRRALNYRQLVRQYSICYKLFNCVLDTLSYVEFDLIPVIESYIAGDDKESCHFGQIVACLQYLIGVCGINLTCCESFAHFFIYDAEPH